MFVCYILNEIVILILFLVAVNETLSLIRRQYEELEREKQALLLDHSSREQTFQSELEKITAEKE
jgi:hypothetical protein